jgi:glutamine amidotransferase
MKVTVVDYGIGNIFSVIAALRAVGVDHVHDTDGSSIVTSDVALVPGVAAFGAGLDLIRSSGQAEQLGRHFRAGKPLVGLCLGAQMFLRSSQEDPEAEGLGFVEGRVVALDEVKCRVPNQGWLRTTQSPASGMGYRSLIVGDPYYYYSHSFRMVVTNTQSEIALARAGTESVLSVYRDQNVTGVQFHPERSGLQGLAFLDRLLSSVRLGNG